MRMKFFRILPEICASTSWPFGKATRNIVPGNTWVTVPVNSIGSSFATYSERFSGLVDANTPWQNQLQKNALDNLTLKSVTLTC